MRSQTVLDLAILEVGENFSKNSRLRDMFDGNENTMEYVYYLCSVLCSGVFCKTLAVHSPLRQSVRGDEQR